MFIDPKNKYCDVTRLDRNRNRDTLAHSHRVVESMFLSCGQTPETQDAMPKLYLVKLSGT